MKGVISVAVVTGRFDLILSVLLNNKFGLHEFYTQEVSKIEDVMSTETFVVYKNYDWKVPYTQTDQFQVQGSRFKGYNILTLHTLAAQCRAWSLSPIG